MKAVHNGGVHLISSRALIVFVRALEILVQYTDLLPPGTKNLSTLTSQKD